MKSFKVVGGLSRLLMTGQTGPRGIFLLLMAYFPLAATTSPELGSIRFGDPGFELRVAEILGDKFEAARPVLGLGLVVTNSSSTAVRAIRVTWWHEFNGAVVPYSFGGDTFQGTGGPQAMIDPGESVLIAPRLFVRKGQQWSVRDSADLALEKVTSFGVDAAIFADGQVHGPDQTGLIEEMVARAKVARIFRERLAAGGLKSLSLIADSIADSKEFQTPWEKTWVSILLDRLLHLPILAGDREEFAKAHLAGIPALPVALGRKNGTSKKAGPQLVAGGTKNTLDTFQTCSILSPNTGVERDYLAPYCNYIEFADTGAEVCYDNTQYGGIGRVARAEAWANCTNGSVVGSVDAYVNVYVQNYASSNCAANQYYLQATVNRFANTGVVGEAIAWLGSPCNGVKSGYARSYVNCDGSKVESAAFWLCPADSAGYVTVTTSKGRY